MEWQVGKEAKARLAILVLPALKVLPPSIDLTLAQPNLDETARTVAHTRQHHGETHKAARTVACKKHVGSTLKQHTQGSKRHIRQHT